MAVLTTIFVDQFALPAFTVMIKEISFSVRSYGNIKL